MSTKRLYSLAALLVFSILLACSIFSRAGTPAPAAARTPTYSPTPAPTRTTAPTSTSTSTPAPTATPESTATPTQSQLSVPEPTATAIPLEVSIIEIPAPSLEGNLLGEGETQPAQIYLPPSYDHTEQRFPVVYFLPGFGSDQHGNNNYFSPDQLAALFSSGQIKEMILVIPNGANILLGSFYVNSPVTGNWEDYILQDVVSYIDSNYRTIPRPEARGISGHSMGGFGAFNLAMRHPDIFCAAYSLSPALFDENGLSDTQMFDQDKKPAAFLRRMEELAGLPEKEAIRRMKHLEGYAGFTAAYGAAFAPDPDHGPPFLDYPFKDRNGQIQKIPAVWRQWETGLGGWPDKIAEYHDNLTGLRGIVFDYGTHDGMGWISRGSEYLSRLLIESGIPNQITTFEGKHGDRVGERILGAILPFFSQVLSDPE